MKRIHRSLVCGIGLLSLLGTFAFASAQGDGASAAKEKIRLKIMVNSGWTSYFPANTDVNSNEWANLYSAKFPEYQFVWDMVPATGYTEKKNLIMASADMPDIINCTQNDIVVWADQSLIQPLDSVIKQNIPLWEKIVVPLRSNEYGLYQGKMWAFTSPLNAKHNVPANFVRKDWLDAVGMKMPTTTDELFNVLVAFTTKDPDGNGKNDTYGMGGSKGLFNMNQAFNPFGVVYGYGDWTRADGKVVPYIVRPEMKEALAFIKRCYDAGVIDPDSFVQDGNKYWEKVRQGAYGFVDYYTNGVVNVAETAMKQTNPKVEFKAVYPPVKGPQGKQMVRTAARGNSGLWAAPVINKHPEAFARVFQWLLEGAGDTFNYGTKENVSFKSVGNFKQEVGRQSDPDFWRMNYRIMFSISSHAASDAGVQAYWQTMAENKLTTPEYPVTIKAQIEYGVADAYFIRSKIAIDKYPELESYFDELKMDIILGKKPISDFDKWVDFFYKNGGTEIVADTTRLNPK